MKIAMHRVPVQATVLSCIQTEMELEVSNIHLLKLERFRSISLKA